MFTYGIRSIRRDVRTYFGILACSFFTTVAAAVFVGLLTSIGARDGVDLDSYNPNRRGLTLATLDAATSFATFGALLAVFTAVFLSITMISYYIEGRRSAFRVYALSGATDGQLYRLTITQVVIVTLFSATLGAVAAQGLLPFFLSILRKTDVVPDELLPHSSMWAVIAVILVAVAVPTISALIYLRGLISRRSFEVSPTRLVDQNSVGKVRIWIVGLAVLAILVLFVIPKDVGDFQLKVALLTMAATAGLSASSLLIVPSISRLVARPWFVIQPGIFTVVSRGAKWNMRRIAATASPILIVLSLCTMVLVLAESGRAVSIYQRAAGMNAQVVVSLKSGISGPEIFDDILPLVERADPEVGAVAYTVDTDWAWTDSRSGIPALARTSSPSVFATTVGLEAKEGSLNDIAGLGVATANPRFSIGDVVPLTSPDGTVHDAVVRAKLPADSFIGQIFLVDWQTFPGGGKAESPKIFVSSQDTSSSAASDLINMLHTSSLDATPGVGAIESWDSYSDRQVRDAWQSQKTGIFSVLAVAVALGLMIMVQSIFSSIAGRVEEYRSLERCGCTRPQIVGICLSDFASVFVSSLVLWIAVFSGFYLFISEYFRYLKVSLIPPVPFEVVGALVGALFVVGLLSYVVSAFVVLRRLDSR
ncbi:FtsX-like permease family protein [Rhodococcus sp. NPDC057135]|uniref:FtsX-like permease family protein n=1 Tax=Rhodococcus sp. NPDC057135 TaxID=3346028 RepID=UPI003635AE2F